MVGNQPNFEEVLERFPRIPCGVFSAPDGLFMELARYECHRLGYENLPRKLNTPLRKEQRTEYAAVMKHFSTDSDELRIIIEAEVCVWLMAHDAGVDFKFLMPYSKDFDTDLWVERWKDMYGYPHLVPWYSAGLFDKSAIRKAVAEGIDPELLGSVNFGV